MTARPADAAAAWVYRGLWGVLTRWFKVPEEPPELPTAGDERARKFRPSRGFLSYLRFHFWLFLLFFGVLAFILWAALLANKPGVAVLVLPVLVILVVTADLIAYLAIHLRYNTTWYVLTDRALRMRRGIWIITEVTLTFENVQNVIVTQGPLQRFFGIANVEIQTAGGGGGPAQRQQGKEGAGAGAHRGLIEGVANAHELRDLILARLRRSRSAGLGDEAAPVREGAPGFGPAHIAVLREIRDAIARESAAGS